jgi:hypothetical protein
VTKPTTDANPQDKKGALRQQIIDAATTKLNTTAEVMNTSSTNFQKSSDKLVDIQTSIGEISATLAGLSASNMSLVSAPPKLLPHFFALLQSEIS